MPQILSKRDVTPPDGFRFTHPETGYRSEAIDWFTWMENIRAHRAANDLPPVTPEQAEDQLCAQLPPENCEGSDPNRPYVNTRISLGDVWDAMKVFGRFAMSGFQFVTQDEANRRARICVGCYNNVNVTGCGACHQLGEAVTGALAQRSTPHDAALKVCGVCRCLNKAQVHIPLDSLDAKDSPERQALYPIFCWLKKGAENYLPLAA